jgi:hypothetical protein
VYGRKLKAEKKLENRLPSFVNQKMGQKMKNVVKIFNFLFSRSVCKIGQIILV